MLTTLLASLTLQAGFETVHPPKTIGMLALGVKPMGVWKVKDRTNPGGVSLTAGGKTTLVFSGNETKMKPSIMTPDTVYKIDGLTWHVNFHVNMFKVTVLDASAATPGKVYTASGNMTGGPKGKMAADALATLKTFKAL